MNTTFDRETCTKCGKTWGVTMPAREYVVCSDCSYTPPLPEGEVRREADGTLVVCLGGGGGTLRWKVIGEDPHRVAMHGWRFDYQVAGCERVGNVHDLLVEPAIQKQPSAAPKALSKKYIDVPLPLNVLEGTDTPEVTG